MSILTLTDLKARFETGDIPSQEDFIDLIDTLLDPDGVVGEAPGPVFSLANLKERFESGKVPTAADFIALIDSFLHTGGGNWPTVLPASSGQNLTNLTLPNPLPAISGANLTGVSTSEFTELGVSGSQVSPTKFHFPGNLPVLIQHRRIYLPYENIPLTTQIASSHYDSLIDKTVVVLADPSDSAAGVLTGFQYSFVRPMHAGGAISPAAIGQFYGGSISAASNLVLPVGNSFNITGLGTIESLSNFPSGTIVRLHMASDGVTIKHDGNKLYLYGQKDVTPEFGDMISFESTWPGFWREIGRTRPAIDLPPAPLGFFPGAVIASARASNSPPPGFLACDGNNYNQDSFPDLFDAIGTSYGSGSSTGQFNVPDYRSEFLRGADNGRNVFPGLAVGQWKAALVGEHDHEYFTGSNGTQNEGGKGTAFAGGTPDDPTYIYNTPPMGVAPDNRPRSMTVNWFISAWGIYA